MSLSGHQSPVMKSDVWLTPPEILARLGQFDLDPCSFHGHPWQVAPGYFTEQDNGLSHQWTGRVWMNPPFGRDAAKWLAKLKEHGNGIALIPARTETRMFFEHVWNGASAVCFLEGRPHFHYPDGNRAPFNSGAPIENEYGERITPERMEEIITQRSWDKSWDRDWMTYGSEEHFHRRNHSLRGPNFLLRRQLVHGTVGHGEGTWDYIERDFS